MTNNFFGEIMFDTGWKTTIDITLFGSTFNIVVKAKAYYEKDGITTEQERAYIDFIDNKDEKLNSVEKLLNEHTKSNASNQFIPRTLLFQRDGEYALLLDDKDDEDDGVVICFSPEVKLLTQNEYL